MVIANVLAVFTMQTLIQTIDIFNEVTRCSNENIRNVAKKVGKIYFKNSTKKEHTISMIFQMITCITEKIVDADIETLETKLADNDIDQYGHLSARFSQLDRMKDYYKGIHKSGLSYANYIKMYINIALDIHQIMGIAPNFF